jgi:hypothetical protein
MPTVPTDDSLGFNPVGALPSVQAPVSAFGGGIAQAEKGLAGAVGQAGDQAFDVAIQRQRIARTTSVNNALNGFLTDTHTVTSGDPNNPNDPGYFGKLGQQAVDGRTGAFSQLNDAFTTRLNSLTDPLARNMFEQEGRRYLNNTQGALDEHYQQQSKAALVGSAQATQGIALQGLSIYANNEQGWQQHFQIGLQAAHNESAARGETNEQAQLRVQDFTEQAKAQRVQTLIGMGQLQTAQDFLKANAPDFKPGTLEALNNLLTPKLRSVQAAQQANDALSQADQGYTAYVGSQAQQRAGQGAGADAITSAIGQQESGSNPNIHPSVQGASGKYQIMPNTFAAAAQPGESFQSEADRETVSKRLLAQYTQQYNGDPARVAVAWFSGPGNVAPPGSAQPFLQDHADANGKTVSSYVSDVVSRMPGVMSKADYYKANYQTILDTTRQSALAAHPDDPTFADTAVARTEQQMSGQIRQQQLGDAADKDTIFQAVNGSLTNGQRPTTVDQLTANPKVAQAWERLQQRQPEVANQIENTLLTENSRGGGDARTYGPGFFQTFNRIHLPDGDPNKITDPAQLYGMVGQANGLTMAGLKQARDEMAAKGTPDGEAESHMRTEFFKDMHGQVTGTDDGLGIKDPKGEDIYLRAMAAAYKNIDALKAAGKTPAQIYSPDSPDYVGKIIPAFKRTLAQRTADMMGANGDGLPPAATDQPAPSGGGFISRLFGTAAPTEDKPDLTTPEGVKKAYLAGKIDRMAARTALTGLPYQPSVPVN